MEIVSVFAIGGVFFLPVLVLLLRELLRDVHPERSLLGLVGRLPK